jgi:aryl sulfotransferase
MANSKGLFWLASYPRSGNTWIRIFLHNYLLDKQTPVDINNMTGIMYASARNYLDQFLGIESSDLLDEEIRDLRPTIYRTIAAQDTLFGDLRILKVHDAFETTSQNEPIFPLDVTNGIIYIVRNPLDVAVSLANFYGNSTEYAVEQINDDKWQLAAQHSRLHSHVNQRLSNWSQHVESWISVQNTPKILIYYEELVLSTEKTFKAILEFLGIPINTARLRKAIEFSSFSTLQTQEVDQGFGEKPVVQRSFFYKGQIGTWQHKLSTRLVAKIIEVHFSTMYKLGYADGEGHPIDTMATGKFGVD